MSPCVALLDQQGFWVTELILHYEGLEK
jgi:hypothetical protein